MIIAYITYLLKNKYEILQSKRRGEPPYSSILTDRRTTEEHANIGILRSSSWKFEVNPSSNLGGDVRSSFLTDRHTDRRTTEYHANIGILRSSFWKFEVNPSSFSRICPIKFLAAPYGPCPTDRVRSKLVSDAKLGTLRNSSWNFELNPLSH